MFEPTGPFSPQVGWPRLARQQGGEFGGRGNLQENLGGACHAARLLPCQWFFAAKSGGKNGGKRGEKHQHVGKTWGKHAQKNQTIQTITPDDGCMVLGALGASNLLHFKKNAGLSWRSRLLAILCRWVSGNEGYDIAILCPHRQLALCNDFLKKSMGNSGS